jgi:SPP1 gp7 family putative phage head morphogenesis protein
MTDEIASDLRQEITRAIINMDSIGKIKDSVKKVMKVGEVRARMIARTEMNRALNAGHMEGAFQSGLTLMKEVNAKIDIRTIEICKSLDGQKIALDSKFKYKGQEWNLPPFHVNCRSRVIYIQS